MFRDEVSWRSQWLYDLQCAPTVVCSVYITSISHISWFDCESLPKKMFASSKNKKDGIDIAPEIGKDQFCGRKRDAINHSP